MTAVRDPAAVPDVLICAGLDPSGGAGLIADTRVVAELGGRPVGVVTALTVQSTTAVVSMEAMTPDVIREQLEFLLSDVEVKAVKLGMTGSSAIAEAIAAALALTQAPLVWDPIIAPSRGDVAFVDNLFGHALTALRPHLTLVTPNAAELAFLSGAQITDLASATAAGQALAARLDCAVLVKGGHLGGDESIDVLCEAGRSEALRGPRIAAGEHVHGTGCALASAIATQLARGAELIEACRVAKQYVAARIANPVRPGRGAPALL